MSTETELREAEIAERSLLFGVICRARRNGYAFAGELNRWVRIDVTDGNKSGVRIWVSDGLDFSYCVPPEDVIQWWDRSQSFRLLGLCTALTVEPLPRVGHGFVSDDGQEISWGERRD